MWLESPKEWRQREKFSKEYLPTSNENFKPLNKDLRDIDTQDNWQGSGLRTKENT